MLVGSGESTPKYQPVNLAVPQCGGGGSWVWRVADGLMSIPGILLAVALMALTRGSVANVMTAITIAEIPPVSRLVRSVVL